VDGKVDNRIALPDCAVGVDKEVDAALASVADAFRTRPRVWIQALVAGSIRSSGGSQHRVGECCYGVEDVLEAIW